MFYKVVRSSDDGFVSCSAEGRWQLNYALGAETVAVTGGIFLFEDLAEAVEFATMYEYEILEVEAENTHYAEAMCWSCDEYALDEYYEGKEYWTVSPTPWRSLVVAEKVIPRRILDMTEV